MADYRFALERGGVKYPCPACQQMRLVRYVDNYTGDQVADDVGRCDREDKCSYHLRPSEYFCLTGKNPFNTPKPEKKRESQSEPEPSFIDAEIMRASLTGYNQNCFCRWLCSVFGEDRALELTDMYKIGTSKHWRGSCVFWQIDKDGKIRGGKIMLYNSATGRRVKEPFNHIQWVHSVMRLEGYHLQQCLFGEHLLSVEDQQKPIAIVESEKTAVVAAGFIPDYVWLAIGGKTSKLKEKLQTVRGRRVVLYPDLMAFDEWRDVAGRMPGFIVSKTLESYASEADRARGLDLADYLLRENGLVLSG